MKVISKFEFRMMLGQKKKKKLEIRKKEKKND